MTALPVRRSPFDADGLPVEGVLVRVLLDGDLHPADGEAQTVRRHLGDDGRRALADLGERDVDDHRPVRVHLHDRCRRREARHRRSLVKRRDALADPAARARLALFLLRGEPAVVDGLGHRLEALEGIARVLVDLLARQRGRAGLEEVLLAELQRVHPDDLGDELHVPLEAPEELDVAESAVGRAPWLVGVDRVGVHPGVRDVVRARRRVGGRAGDVDGVVGVGAGVPVHRAASAR